jgi:homogentisate 1,2-dioxygenase
MENFKSSGIHTKQAHVKIPAGHFEEEHGRNGFFGRVSHLYHQQPPVGWTNIEGELKPQSQPPMFTANLEKNLFQPILLNEDLVISIGHYNKSFEHFYRSADFDEMLFVHDGSGRIETVYGHLEYVKGDYVIIPRGTTYKLYLKTDTKIFKVESRSEFEQPDRGMLGPNALYDQTAIVVPTAAVGSEQDKKEYKVEIKRLGKITTVTYPYNPLCVSGWKGSVYPFKLSIYDFCPVTSHRYHMPPSAHTTFVCKNFVICSFVERPLEESKHEVLKVPFYHSNIDFDEVLFYHQGNFFSRDGIDAGALTFHPQGIHHGPHPKAFKAANDKTYTDEFAVMVDAKRPLIPSEWFAKNENKDYWKSWMA